LRVGLGVLRGERVARIGESHHVGRGVIHEAHPPHARAVHDLEQRARIVHHLDHQVPMRVLTAPHRLEHVRLELAPRLDVDVNVGDAGQRLAGCQPGVIHGAQKVPWDRSGFNYALVRTPSGRNTGSCGAATVRAARPSGLPSHVAISDVARAQQGGAELAPTPQEPRTADNTGTFYVSSELGLSAGTLAWKSTDGGLHYTALESPNQLSQAAGGVGPGGGDTDLSTAPDANTSGIHNVYVASLTLANVTVSTSQDGGKTWSKNVLSATIPGDDREWIAADQASKVCISYHDIVTFNIDVNCSFDAGATFTQLGSAIDVAHAFLIDDNEIGNLAIDPRNHVIYQVFSGIANTIEALLPSSFHAVWIAVSRDGGQTFTDQPVYVNPNTSVSYGHQFVNVSVDRAGTVYVVYTDNHNLFYSFSTDGGGTWTGPIQVNQAPSA